MMLAMTDQDAEKADKWSGHFMALAIMTLFASMVVTTYAFKGYPNTYRDLGMSELPWTTSMAIQFIHFFLQYWFVVAPIFAVGAVLAGSGILGRPPWIAVGFVFCVSLTLPAAFYMVLHMPIVELQRKLGA